MEQKTITAGIRLLVVCAPRSKDVESARSGTRFGNGLHYSLPTHPMTTWKKAESQKWFAQLSPFVIAGLALVKFFQEMQDMQKYTPFPGESPMAQALGATLGSVAFPFIFYFLWQSANSKWMSTTAIVLFFAFSALQISIMLS